MTTFAQLVDEVSSSLAGYVRDQEKTTHLAQPLAADGLVMTVADPTQVSKGRLEVGDEIIWVDSVDRSSRTATIPPYGRGFDSTSVASHDGGSRVTYNPLYPRSAIRRAINDTIRSTSGQLFGVSTVELTSSVIVTHELPAATEAVIAVSYQELGPTEYWRPVRSWTFRPNANTAAFPSGRAIDLHEPILSGRIIHVVTAIDPQPLTSDTNEFTETTGLAESARDVITLGACARLLAFTDASRLDTTSVESDAFNEGTPIGAAINVSRWLFSLFKSRMAEERARLLSSYPPQIHYTR